jgi:hypothetical protein
MLDITTVAGAYIMAASGAYTTAWYETEPGVAQPQTYFTKYLVDLVEKGIPGQAPGLTLHTLYNQLRHDLERDKLPVPCIRSVDAARDFVFAHNAAPPQTHRDLDKELQHLTQQLAQAEAAEAKAKAEAQFREQTLRAEAAKRAEELERLHTQALNIQSMADRQQQELHEAIQAAGSVLDQTNAAKASAAADSTAAAAADSAAAAGALAQRSYLLPSHWNAADRPLTPSGHYARYRRYAQFRRYVPSRRYAVSEDTTLYMRPRWQIFAPGPVSGAIASLLAWLCLFLLFALAVSLLCLVL